MWSKLADERCRGPKLTKPVLRPVEGPHTPSLTRACSANFGNFRARRLTRTRTCARA